MSDNWAALMNVGSIAFGRLTIWSFFSSCLCPSWSNFRWSAMLLYANFDGLWWACLLPKLLLYLGKIGLIGLELNSEGNNFSFICCAKQQTILLGVPRAWRVLHDHHLSDLEWSFLSVITTCDRSANIHVACSTRMQHFFVTSGSPARFAVSKGVVHFWAVCLHCLYFFVCSWWRKVTLMIWKDLNP